MTDTSAYEARVQVLTAEVRTLVVGSRQVTMSVYSQLDEVTPDKIEPFGRVNPKDGGVNWMYVVGRQVASGVLVRSSAWLKLEMLEDQRFKDKFFPDTTQQQLAKVVEQWTALPLIVLAGLR